MGYFQRFLKSSYKSFLIILGLFEIQAIDFLEAVVVVGVDLTFIILFYYIIMLYNF